MFSSRIARLAAAVALAFTSAGITAVSASAVGVAPGTGISGACNMVFTHAGTQLNAGMQNAMFKNTVHGNGSNGDSGMFVAVGNTGSCSGS